MPLAGGASDKYGLNYELSWTVLSITDVLDGRALRIRFEPPGDEGQGIEFWVETESGFEFHQVKRQRTGHGYWSLSALAAEKVLSNFFARLSDPSALCVFASTHAAHPLDELADRAQRSKNWEEFRDVFLANQGASSDFATLHKIWNHPDREESFNRLTRIRVKPIGEDLLRTLVLSRLEISVEGDTESVFDTLNKFVLDAVHGEFTGEDIWNFLNSRGYCPRTWGTDPSVVQTVEEQNLTYFSAIRQANIGGQVIPRKEVDQVCEILNSESDRNSVLLSGEAGTGKSLIIPQVVDRFADQGCPVLAFRVDRLLPTFQPTELGVQLGLPGSPVSVLASISDGGKSLLIIDQLDAVSLASARNPEFFDCIGAILDQARNYPEMRILLACRKFDLTHDSRFRRLIDSHGTATEVAVGRFDDDTVRGLVSGIGLDPNRITSNQMDLLSLPFHLSLLAEITADGSVDGLDFQTTKDLYDRFWDAKQARLRARLYGPIRSLFAVEALAQNMSENQVLSAPASILENFGDEASVMASEGILVLEKSRYSFFHESFFDYVFARSMESSNFNLTELLLGDEQYLFRRAQLRQILVHQREGDWNTYIENTKGILKRNDIRFHLKKTVLALMASLKNPQIDEWKVLEDLIKPIQLASKIGNRARRLVYQVGVQFFPEKITNRWHFREKIITTEFAEHLSEEVWMSIRGSVGWFDLLDSSGVLHDWLNGSREGRIDRVVWIFRSFQNERPDRVAELLTPFIDVSEQWNIRILHLISWSSIGASRPFFEFVLTALDKGTLDELRGPVAVNSEFWDVVIPLSKGRPKWASEITGHYFNRRLDRIIELGHKNPFQDYGEVESISQSGQSVILECAEGDPKAFIEHVLPFMIKAIEINADMTNGPPWRDPIWSMRIYGVKFGVDNSLLAAMEKSLRTLAAEDPAEFRSIADELDQSKFETVQYLLLRAYSAAGPKFADSAVKYLLEDPIKFAFGYLSDAHWVTAQVIASSTPDCSEEILQLLETALMNYYHPYERTADGRQSYGHSQWQLLSAIDFSRLSDTGKQRLQELNRKFGDTAGVEPTGIVTSGVPSPIPDDSALKMTDEQWIRAITRYDSGDSDFSRNWTLTGGANQLAGVLESQIRTDPDRIARIALQIPMEANTVYLESVLRGIVGSNLSPEKITEICMYCHQFPNRPFGRWITDPLAKIRDSELPTEALELVAWYATKDPDPKYLPTDDQDQDLLSRGINSVRGRAAESMGHLIFADRRRVEVFLPYIKEMVQDSSVVVRSCVAFTLQGILRHERELAVELFINLCDTDDNLLGTTHVEMFLKYSVQTHFSVLTGVFSRMIRSRTQNVAAAGARQICLASLTNESAIPLARRCVSGQKPLRLGAAEVFAANLKDSSIRSACEKSLVRLFSDPDEEVRQAAAVCFNGIGESRLGEYRALLREFIRSPSFNVRQSLLFRVLEDSTAEISEEILLACERFLDVAGAEAGDISTSSAANSSGVTKLVLRVYSRSTSSEIRSRCLDLIDRMTAFNVYGLANAIEPLER